MVWVKNKPRLWLLHCFLEDGSRPKNLLRDQTVNRTVLDAFQSPGRQFLSTGGLQNIEMIRLLIQVPVFQLVLMTLWRRLILTGRLW